MIHRLRLPRELDLLDTANDDRDDTYKAKDPMSPRKCDCDLCTPSYFAAILGAAFLAGFPT